MCHYLLIFRNHIKQEFLCSWRQPSNIMFILLFYVAVVVFFPLSFPPNAKLLSQVAPALIWIALLLTMLRAAEGMFNCEYQEGIIEQWILGNYPIKAIIQAKFLVHWLLLILPVLALSPAVLLLYHYDKYQLFLLISAIIVGSPTVLALCALAAIFSVGLTQRGALMALIVFPLAVPVLVFGAGLPAAVIGGQAALALLALLLAFSMLAVAFIPFAIEAIICMDSIKVC